MTNSMATTNPQGQVANLQSERPYRNALLGVYEAILLFGVLFTAGMGIRLLNLGQSTTGLLYLAAAIIWFVLWFGSRRDASWSRSASRLVHIAGLLFGGALLVVWLTHMIFVVGMRAADTLWLTDAVLIFAINSGLLWLLRYISKSEREVRIQSTYRSDLEMQVQRFVNNNSARIGGLLVIILFTIVYLMPRIDPYTREIALSDGDLTARLSAPDCFVGWIRAQQGLDGTTDNSVSNQLVCKHPFGTDKNGRDLMRRVLHGISVSLAVSLISVAISLLIGATIGLLAGYVGGGLDNFLMRIMDIMLAFPALLLAIAIVAMRGPGLENAMLAIGIVGIPTYARLARSMSIALREQEFVTAAHSVGVGQWRILRKHILPNSMAPLIVQSTLGLGTAVIETAALGFLGLGQQPPMPELGKMLAESREVMTSGKWWMIVFPGITVMIIVLSFNLLGDALRDTLDPRLRGR